VRGHAVDEELVAGGDERDLLGLAVFEAEFASGLNACCASAADDNGLRSLDLLLDLVELVLCGFVSCGGGLPWRFSDVAGSGCDD
jgi:hypothetical protein